MIPPEGNLPLPEQKGQSPDNINKRGTVGRKMAPGENFDISQQTRLLLEKFYSIKNPEKLSTIDTILQRFSGEEDELILQLMEKYNISLSDIEGMFPHNKMANLLAKVEVKLNLKANKLDNKRREQVNDTTIPRLVPNLFQDMSKTSFSLPNFSAHESIIKVVEPQTEQSTPQSLKMPFPSKEFASSIDDFKTPDRGSPLDSLVKVDTSSKVGNEDRNNHWQAIAAAAHVSPSHLQRSATKIIKQLEIEMDELCMSKFELQQRLLQLEQAAAKHVCSALEDFKLQEERRVAEKISATLQDIQDENQRLRAQLLAGKHGTECLKRDVATLYARLGAREAEVQQAKQELSAVVAATQDELQKLKSQREEASELKQLLAESQEQCIHLQSQLDSARQDSASQRTEINDLIEQRREQAAEIRYLTGRLYNRIIEEHEQERLSALEMEAELGQGTDVVEELLDVPTTVEAERKLMFPEAGELAKALKAVALKAASSPLNVNTAYLPADGSAVLDMSVSGPAKSVVASDPTPNDALLATLSRALDEMHDRYVASRVELQLALHQVSIAETQATEQSQRYEQLSTLVEASAQAELQRQLVSAAELLSACESKVSKLTRDLQQIKNEKIRTQEQCDALVCARDDLVDMFKKREINIREHFMESLCAVKELYMMEREEIMERISEERRQDAELRRLYRQDQLLEMRRLREELIKYVQAEATSAKKIHYLESQLMQAADYIDQMKTEKVLNGIT